MRKIIITDRCESPWTTLEIDPATKKQSTSTRVDKFAKGQMIEVETDFMPEARAEYLIKCGVAKAADD